MRIATFNCNSIRVRLGAVMNWLDEYSPDVLALQETKCVDKDFPRAEIEDKGWHVVYRGEKSYNGVAAITREKPKSFSFGLGGDDGASETRLVRIRVGNVDIVNTYVPQGRALDNEMFRFKLQWLARLKAYFEKEFNPDRDKLIWVGDLNVAPTPIDVYDSKAVWPHVCHCREVIDAFDDVVAFGFTDVFRKHLPEPNIFTFWDFRQKSALERNRGWRIDHILATRTMASKSTACGVDFEARGRERPSDHTFVYADFDI